MTYINICMDSKQYIYIFSTIHFHNKKCFSHSLHNFHQMIPSSRLCTLLELFFYKRNMQIMQRPAAILDFNQTGKTGDEQNQVWSAAIPLQAQLKTVSVWILGRHKSKSHLLGIFTSVKLKNDYFKRQAKRCG